MRTGAWVWSLSCIGAGFAPGYPLLVASRGGVAVGEAIATSAAVSLISELTGEKYRARATGAFLASAFIGAGCAAIAGGAIVDFFHTAGGIVGWRAALVAAGLPGILGALCLQSLFPREPARRPAALPAPRFGISAVLVLAAAGAMVLQMCWRPTLSVPLCVLMTAAIAVWWIHGLARTRAAAYQATLGQGRFRCLVFAFAAVMCVDYAAGFWLIPYAQRHFGLSAATVGSHLGTLMVIGGIAGCVLGGWAADHWRTLQKAGRVWTALIAVLVEGVAILVALGQSDYRAFIVAFALFCVASGGWPGVAAAIAFDHGAEGVPRHGDFHLFPVDDGVGSRAGTVSGGPGQRRAGFGGHGAGLGLHPPGGGRRRLDQTRPVVQQTGRHGASRHPAGPVGRAQRYDSRHPCHSQT